MLKRPTNWLLAMFVAAWACSAAAGLLIIIHHKSTPGPAGHTVEWLPAGIGVPLNPDHPTLLLFLHPRCPCSLATLDGFARIMESCRGRVAGAVYCYRPADVGDEWAMTRSWRDAGEIPGLQVTIDVGGRVAHRIGVVTSGHVVLFSPNGQLLFSGGITPTRGHSGENHGHDSVVALLNGTIPACQQTPVFGCPLVNPVRHD